MCLIGAEQWTHRLKGSSNLRPCLSLERFASTHGKSRCSPIDDCAWQTINTAGMLLAVAGEEDDVRENGSPDDDCRFWICRTEAPARKLVTKFAQDNMFIEPKKWAVDVRWFKVHLRGEDGVQYKMEAGSVCTIPLDSCLKLNDLKWHSSSANGKLGLLKHSTFDFIEEQWRIEVLR